MTFDRVEEKERFFRRARRLLDAIADRVALGKGFQGGTRFPERGEAAAVSPALRRVAVYRGGDTPTGFTNGCALFTA